MTSLVVSQPYTKQVEQNIQCIPSITNVITVVHGNDKALTFNAEPLTFLTSLVITRCLAQIRNHRNLPDDDRINYVLSHDRGLTHSLPPDSAKLVGIKSLNSLTIIKKLITLNLHTFKKLVFIHFNTSSIFQINRTWNCYNRKINTRTRQPRHSNQ